MPRTIAILGGTGAEGRGLARRWADAGHTVRLGSRSPERAAETARSLGEANRGAVLGSSHAEAVQGADVIVLALPHGALEETLTPLRSDLRDKIVLSAVVPLDFRREHLFAPPREGSAAEQAQTILGPQANVVAALHHVSAHDLEDLDRALDADVLLVGDDAASKAVVSDLLRDIGLRPLDAGALRHAGALEAMTVALIQLNRKYKTKSARFKVLGLE